MPAARATKPNPRDLTGTRKAALAAAHQKEIEEAQVRLSMNAQQRKADLEQPIALGPDGREVREVEMVDPEVPVNIEPETVRIRVSDKLENVTIGQGTSFNFEEGQVYEVPLHVARHLDRIGYVWQWL
jgi:hypothetical protein